MAHFYTGVNPVCALREAMTAQTTEVWAVLRHCVLNKGLHHLAPAAIPARIAFGNGFCMPLPNAMPF